MDNEDYQVIYKVSRGNINKTWPDNFKDFPYKKKPVLDRFGNPMPENTYGWLYDNSNPMPDWIDAVKSNFDLDEMTCSFYKMQSGEVMPVHQDRYDVYRKLKGVEFQQVARIIVMLEDWKSGHYLEVNGTAYTNWIAGDWFMWQSDCPHSAANIGVEDRYTLQITGLVQKSLYDTWARLWAWNIPNWKQPEQLPEFITNLYRKVEADTPVMIYGYNGRLQQLDGLEISDAQRDLLNEQGLDIYLYEPLCSYRSHDPVKVMGFYGEFKDNWKSNLRADELDSIESFVKANKLEKVVVHTGDYDVERYYGTTYPALKLVTDDIFLKSLPYFPPIEHIEERNNFRKKFISMNWRYTPHRHMTAAYLSMLSSSYITWFYKAGIPTIFNNKGWADAEFIKNRSHTAFDKMIQGVTKLNEIAPVSLDLLIKEPTVITTQYPLMAYPSVVGATHPLDPSATNRIAPIETFYNDVFCDIVTESRFAQPTGNYSEKAYQPMYYRKPFVLVAPPKTLKYLKEQGFKTFGNFWNESYDFIDNHSERMLAIFSVIEYIESKSLDELRAMYDEMSEILEHNFNLYQERVKIK